MSDYVQQMRFGEFMQRALLACDISDVFGIPGVHNVELFRDLDSRGFRVTIPRHEQGAGFMADAYYRTTGRPAACAFITGPGVLNALTPIAQAWHDSIPLLVLASTMSEEELLGHQGALHDTPAIEDTLRPYTNVSRVVRTSEEFTRALEDILIAWRTERPRPAFIGVPRNLMGALVPASDEFFDRLARAHKTKAVLSNMEGYDFHAVAAELLEARSPVIIAGGGALSAREKLRELAEKVEVPVALTGNAKASLPADHPLSLGVSVGFPETKKLLEESDLVIALGTELSHVEYLNTGESVARLQRVIRVDIDPKTIEGSEHGSACCSAQFWLENVLEALHVRGPLSIRSPNGQKRAQEVRAQLRERRESDPFASWISALESSSPNDTIFALDSAQLAYQSHNFLDLAGEQQWLAPYGLGTLGPALPMAVGAAIASPATPVVALAGDGGSLFTIQELATAADLNRQLTVVIWDNEGYKEIEKAFRSDNILPVGVATSIQNISIAARGFGAEVAEVRTPSEFSAALEQSFESSALTLIRVLAPVNMKVQSDNGI